MPLLRVSALFKRLCFGLAVATNIAAAPLAGAAVDTSSCDSLAGPDPTQTLHALTNAEYATSVRELFQIAADASAGLPSDALGGSFDTNATHAFTASVAAAYLGAAQQMTTVYLNSGHALCTGEGFNTGCTSWALVTLAERAFRRPLLASENAVFSGMPYNLTSTGMSLRDAYATGLAAILIAPQFIYRSQVTPSGGIAHPELYALAARLSYTLWSSLPDATLLALANSGQLADRSTLSAQIERLLADPKAAAFSRNFAGQWLGTRFLASAPAAGHLDPALVAGYGVEAESYFSEFLRQNRNIRDLLDARFSYVDTALAQHYQVNAPWQNLDNGFGRIDLDGTRRFGLLSQGSFLMQTSNPDSTSPVKRGKWILDNILCSAPPPPPPGIPALADVDPTLPIRQRLAMHRTSPACAGCHVRMDPIGLAFENYDQSGAWRDTDSAGRAIDPSGRLRGTAFNTPVQLVALLKDDPAFPRCVAVKLATYALGRKPTAKESCVARLLADQSHDDSYGLKSLLLDLSLSLLAQ